jgi:hypothetical protein
MPCAFRMELRLILRREADTIELRVHRGQNTRQDVLRRQAAFEDDGQRRARQSSSVSATEIWMCAMEMRRLAPRTSPGL